MTDATLIVNISPGALDVLRASNYSLYVGPAKSSAEYEPEVESLDLYNERDLAIGPGTSFATSRVTLSPNAANHVLDRWRYCQVQPPDGQVHTSAAGKSVVLDCL
jgi:hypothetical protein